MLYRINSCYSGFCTKRKCGVVRLSDSRHLAWPENKINNTPHRISRYQNDICLYTVTSVCIACPCSLIKSPNFTVKAQRNTFTNMLPFVRNGITKIGKFFNIQHSLGYCKIKCWGLSADRRSRAHSRPLKTDRFSRYITQFVGDARISADLLGTHLVGGAIQFIPKLFSIL